ncbi:MAG: family 10 glycosylhydrolase [Clostridia bacterium]|nr:family 10 glycosylhydrolase [Clostridia bacterium]
MKMKQLLAVLLSMAMICGLIPAMSFSASAAPTLTTSYEPHKYYVGTIDAEADFRSEGHTVIYKYGFDAAKECPTDSSDKIGTTTNNDWYLTGVYTGANYTCTNQWGVEVAVNEFGLVIAKGTAGNMAIPQNGYVISAVNGSTQKPGPNVDAGTELKDNVEVGDYIRVSGSNYYVYRTTDDSKFTDESKAFDIKKTQVLEIVEGGNSPTKSTHWTTTLLCKATGTGSDGNANHAGYFVKLGGEEIDPVPSGYFALVVSGTPLKDGGASSYNAADLFEDYVAPGSIVNIGSNEIYFRHDVAAAKRAALLMTGKTDSTVTKVEDFSAYTILNDAKTKFELVDTARMQTLYDNMVSIANAVQSMTTFDEMEPYMATLYQNYEEIRSLEFEKRAVETRALWWRPLENEHIAYSAAELDAHIEENVSRFKALGYNQLFVEAFYNSCTIFPVPASAGYNGLYFAQNPYLVPTNMKCGSSGLYGKNSKLSEPYDMLKRTIEICDEYDIECHVWWEVLYIGYERHNVTSSDDFVEYGVGYTIENDIKKNGSSSKYYNWLNVAQDGSLRSGTNTTLTRLWLNPGNTGARTFLLNLLDYVCATYDPYSFQLDYFRHPNDGVHEFGYDTDTVAAFKAKHTSYKNVDLTASGYWKDATWLQFRADYITSLIGEMRALLDEKYPFIALTTSPDPDPESALKECLQDVSAWLGNGYIDNIYPMAYGVHLPGFVTPTLVEQNADRFVSTGLSVAYKNEELEMEWVRQIRHAGADGVAHFGEIEHYSDTIWSEPAVSPTGNAARAVRVYLNETVTDRAAKMKELGAITQTQYDNILTAVKNAEFAVRVNGVESTTALTAINAIQTVANGMSNANVKAALTSDVNYILKIRKNSHDVARQAREEAKSDFTFEAPSGTTYISGSDTLYVTKNNTKLSGAILQPVNVLTAEAVSKLELDNVSFKSGDNVAFEVLGSALKLELTGTNNVTFDDLSNLDVTYCGTGALYNGDDFVLQMGDVSGNKLLNSDDLRSLLQANVKIKTLSASQKAISDANGDGRIDTIDTRIFLDAVVG